MISMMGLVPHIIHLEILASKMKMPKRMPTPDTIES